MKDSYTIYQKYYDKLHPYEEYEKDIKEYIRLFHKYKLPDNLSLIDLGCGTGKHLKMFKNSGYSVIGIDTSKNMIKYAKKHNPDIEFIQGDIRDLTLTQNYDVCISNDNPLGYILDTDDLIDTFKYIGSNLKKNGLFIFGIFNGIAVLIEKPKITYYDSEDLFRISFPLRNEMEHRFNVISKFFYNDGGRYKLEQEVHRMRFYLPKEIEYYLKLAGFELLEILNLDGQEAIARDWDVRYVCRLK